MKIKKFNEHGDTAGFDVKKSKLRTVTIGFTEESDYIDFKEFVKEEGFEKIIFKDHGKESKYPDGHWYLLIIIVQKIKEFYGDDWAKELEYNFPSVIIS